MGTSSFPPFTVGSESAELQLEYMYIFTDVAP